MQNAKSILSSWTFWFGLAQVLYGGFGVLSGNLDQAQSWTLIVTGLSSIGLRIKTVQPVALS